MLTLENPPPTLKTCGDLYGEEYEKNYSKTFQKMVEKCLQRDPAKRFWPTFYSVHIPLQNLSILVQSSVQPIVKLSQPTFQFLSHIVYRPTATELLKHPFFKKAKENDFLVQTIIEKGPSFASRAKRV